MSLVYQAFNTDVAGMIPNDAARILDIGCGNGALGAWLKSKRLVEVDGITFSEAEALHANTWLDTVFIADLNQFDFTKTNGNYDCIICSHVLEHLYEPWDIVKKLEAQLAPNGIILMAFPNVLFFKQRMQFLIGHFTYSTHGGLMDITHFRFFDWASVELLYRDTTLQLVSKKATGMFPQPLIRKIAPQLSAKIDQLMVRRFPGLFGLQFLLVLKRCNRL